MVFKDSRSCLCSNPTFHMPVFKSFTVTPGGDWLLLGEGTNLSVFVEIQLLDPPGVQQLEKKSEQVSVLQTINNNQQMLHHLLTNWTWQGNHHAMGLGHGTSLCLSAVTRSPSSVPGAAHQVYFSLKMPKWQLIWEGKIRVSILWEKFASFNNLFGVRKISCCRK